MSPFPRRTIIQPKKNLVLGNNKKVSIFWGKKCNQKPVNGAADPVTASLLSWAMFVNCMTHASLEAWPQKSQRIQPIRSREQRRAQFFHIATCTRTTESHRN